MKYSSVKGMYDILPQDIRGWHALEGKARASLENFGFTEIRTPILEETAVFVRSVGETSDIVTKEMFTFMDRKERSLSLRPEGTASVVRAYVEHNLQELSQELRLYYIGPMFRSERPQKGRSRQFYQIGTEIIGSNSPYADIELICQLDEMLKSFGLQGYAIKINSLGCFEDKAKYAELLKKYFSDKKSALCEECRTRIEKNALRILDCKNESCKNLIGNVPDILESQCDGCRSHFKTVQNGLDKMGIKYVHAKNLVRGLDYYTKTVFEITHSNLGSQDAICAGGRYDNLVKEFGGPDVGAVGYAAGMERLLLAMGNIEEDFRAFVGIATMGDEAKIAGLKLAADIRNGLGIAAVNDIRGASFKSQLRLFDKMKANAVIIIGEDEIKKGTFPVKDMKMQSQEEVPAEKLVEALRGILKRKA